MQTTVQCKYSCHKCGISKRVITAVSRREGEDVKVFIDRVASLACSDHDRRSPNCIITSLSELMIPFDEQSGRVGDVVIDMKGKRAV